MAEESVRWSEPPGLPRANGGTVVTVGTFDGVHRGHWEVLREVRRRADRTGRRSVLVTFDPHPLRIVRPAAAPPLLTTPVEKKEILAESGLDYAVFLSFTPALSRYSPRRFVEEVLISRLCLEHLVIGYDHGFGRGRSGDVDTLRSIGAELGFEVDVVEAVGAEGAAVSSSAIRGALQVGDVQMAAGGLGRPYSLRGPVVRGDGRGRQLGFPTANVHVEGADKLLPLEGVYAVRGVLRGGAVDGVLHLGPRPTFRGSPPSVELHLFDFDADIYGEEIRIDFVARIRPIHRFATAAELVEAIRGDCEEARALLAEDAARSDPGRGGTPA
ncbi:MAG TPA: bifunctional riboflavin kinase/FAD synthetase [Longimicrobiales bacterium]|nr:bifunctional riboflavin kinase/FAD synthetase [Longimicrobiales bacterium]